MGGGWCINKADCANRWKNSPFLMSTLGLPDTVDVSTRQSGVPDVVFPKHGILSASLQENPYFGSWNRVHLWYCSSDSHLGEAAGGEQPNSPSTRALTSTLANCAPWCSCSMGVAMYIRQSGC